MTGKRRKGKRRPNTVGKDCLYLAYDAGVAVCRLKARANDIRENDAKYGCTKAYEDVACCKSRYCGYEPAEKKTVDELSSKLRLGISRLEDEIRKLKDMI